MNIIHTNITVGAKSPFTVLHMSDTHLCRADDRNDQRKTELAERRQKAFPESEECLLAGIKEAKTLDCPVFHTGDLLDFVSFANVDAAKNFTDNCDVFMAAGNHEFSLYVGEAFEDEEYRNRSLPLVQSAFNNNIRFATREINGILFIAVDNSYYLFDQQQLEQLQKELKKNMPTVLLMHTPLHSEGLYNHMMHELHNECAYLMNVPDEKTALYSDHRRIQQTADKTTKEAYELIVGSKNIKAIITGHLHFDYEDTSLPCLPQYVTACTTLRVIRFD